MLKAANRSLAQKVKKTLNCLVVTAKLVFAFRKDLGNTHLIQCVFDVQSFENQPFLEVF